MSVLPCWGPANVKAKFENNLVREHSQMMSTTYIGWHNLWMLPKDFSDISGDVHMNTYHAVFPKLWFASICCCAFKTFFFK